ncbi:hypothetical protein [Kosakonia cowanii]|uniref:hypothetical protein n=1 Tax=Kosakonia cowanii TaxID=208223 RepID=UPI0028ACA8D1|nr:hypothetical protein [Kosakonia cowanii]
MDERAPAGRRITPLLIEDGYEVRHLLPDGGENALSGLRTAGYCFCCRMAAERLIRPTNCGVRLLLPDAAKTPYPAYKLRVRLVLPDGGENALSGLRTAGCGLCCRMAAKTPYPAYELRVAAFVAGCGDNALSGLMGLLL